MRFFTTVTLVALATLSLAVASDARPVDGEVLDIEEYPQKADEHDYFWTGDAAEEDTDVARRDIAWRGSTGFDGHTALKHKVDAEAHHKGNLMYYFNHHPKPSGGGHLHRRSTPNDLYDSGGINGHPGLKKKYKAQGQSINSLLGNDYRGGHHTKLHLPKHAPFESYLKPGHTRSSHYTLPALILPREPEPQHQKSAEHRMDPVNPAHAPNAKKNPGHAKYPIDVAPSDDKHPYGGAVGDQHKDHGENRVEGAAGGSSGHQHHVGGSHGLHKAQAGTRIGGNYGQPTGHGQHSAGGGSGGSKHQNGPKYEQWESYLKPGSSATNSYTLPGRIARRSPEPEPEHARIPAEEAPLEIHRKHPNKHGLFHRLRKQPWISANGLGGVPQITKRNPEPTVPASLNSALHHAKGQGENAMKRGHGHQHQHGYQAAYPHVKGGNFQNGNVAEQLKGHILPRDPGQGSHHAGGQHQAGRQHAAAGGWFAAHPKQYNPNDNGPAPYEMPGRKVPAGVHGADLFGRDTDGIDFDGDEEDSGTHAEREIPGSVPVAGEKPAWHNPVWSKNFASKQGYGGLNFGRHGGVGHGGGGHGHGHGHIAARNTDDVDLDDEDDGSGTLVERNGWLLPGNAWLKEHGYQVPGRQNKQKPSTRRKDGQNHIASRDLEEAPPVQPTHSFGKHDGHGRGDSPDGRHRGGGARTGHRGGGDHKPAGRPQRPDCPVTVRE